ncbi:PREDICTED: protein FAM205A-like [Chrysochloris asiatica]|uniref:Protein FAM205A-like n=1 Tax=Chrysochloris asiatica TaxID=185453 RepID=A0A9B0TNV1_CHRAS|nr:PREDICTED: protein FAM205A-like [Chrysochloris asiatica]
MVTVFPADWPFLSSEGLRFPEVNAENWMYFQKRKPCRSMSSPQDSLCAVMEHTELSPSLAKGTNEHLEATFQHKCLAFLSGLPGALSPPLVPAMIDAEMMPKSGEITAEPLTETVSREEPDRKWVHLKDLVINELKAVQQSQKSRRSVPAHWLSKISEPSGDLTNAQVVCVQEEARMNSPSLEKVWYPESQGPGKSKDSTQVPTLLANNHENAKPAGDHGEQLHHVNICKPKIHWILSHRGRSQRAQCAVQYEFCVTAQSPGVLDNSWSGKFISDLTRELLFFPDHVQTPRDFHLQKRLSYPHWGLPILSIQHFLSPAGLQPLPGDCTTLERGTLPPPAVPEVNGAIDQLSPTPGLLPRPHLLTQVHTVLQSYRDSTCWLTHRCPVSDHDSLSRDCKVPASLAVDAYKSIPGNQSLEPDQHQKAVTWMPAAVDQYQHISPGAVMEHTELSPSLAEGTNEHLEATFQHKCLAFLSGLPGALSPPLVPAMINAEMMPDSGETTAEPLTETVSREELGGSLEPALQEDKKTGAQGQEKVALTPLGSLTDTDVPHSDKAAVITKLNFYLKKFILEKQLGIPVKVRESRDLHVTAQQHKTTQEALGSLNSCRRPPLHKIPFPPDTPYAPPPEWVHLKDLVINELKAVQQSQKSRRSVPVHWLSKISEPSGDLTNAQVVCVQEEARMNSPSLEKVWYPESQGPGKSKDSAQVPTLLASNHENAKPAGDHGEQDAKSRLRSVIAEDQRPAETPVDRTPRALRKRNQSFDLAACCQQTPNDSQQRKLPEHGHNPKLGGPSGTVQAAVPQTSQGQPLMGPVTPCKYLQAQDSLDPVSQRQAPICPALHELMILTKSHAKELGGSEMSCTKPSGFRVLSKVKS